MNFVVRMAAILTAIRGGFDNAMNLSERVLDLEHKLKKMHETAEGIQKERDRWAEMWRQDGLGHVNAQELMAQEIDRLLQMLTRAIETMERSGQDVSFWKSQLKGYSDTQGFLDAVARNKAAFFEQANHQ